tara:strand:- start:198211 stop:198420 length:210 start_codon:yes stop_codon:yes gene_type:complete
MNRFERYPKFVVESIFSKFFSKKIVPGSKGDFRAERHSYVRINLKFACYLFGASWQAIDDMSGYWVEKF